MLEDLAACVLQIERDGIDGLVIEAGAARGGSAIVLAAAKSPARPMKVYDVFGTIPPPTERDGADVHRRYATITAGEAKGPGGETYYGYRDDLYHEVEDSFARHGVPVGEHNVELVRGLFEDTIQLDEPVAFAHLDGDWYESTMTCMTRIAPLLAAGGGSCSTTTTNGPAAGVRSTSTSPATRATGSSTVRSSMSSVSDAVTRVRARGAGVARDLLRRLPSRPARRRRLRPPLPPRRTRRPRPRTRAGRCSSGSSAAARWTRP